MHTVQAKVFKLLYVGIEILLLGRNPKKGDWRIVLKIQFASYSFKPPSS